MSNQKFILGFSPCPNDTFIFDALVHGRIDTEPFSFDVRMDDVEALNKWAISGEPDITKISFASYPWIAESYQLLRSGSALGFGSGPLFVSKLIPKDPEHVIRKVAIPGMRTTANFLFSEFFPGITEKKEMLFSDIESAVLNDEVDAGVIIHESRFTYAQKGLKKICDLGELWEEKTKRPIPLGGIAIRRSLPADVKQKIENLISESVKYAFANPTASKSYVAEHAQEMEEEVRGKHIELYVNKYSIILGPEGEDAVRYFLSGTALHDAFPKIKLPVFLDKP